ncbi:MAG: response regulator transcription factor [Actinomycetota bacterium]|nr:response regulator transcription factor [Actinomycetota bacterium]
MRSLRVIVVGFGPIYRAGLCAVLPTSGEEMNVSVVGVSEDLAGATSLTRLLRPDVVVTDLDFSERDPIAALKDACPPIRILVLGESRDPARAAGSLSQSVDGYLARPIAKEDLLDALFSVAAGESVVDPRLTMPTPLMRRGLKGASLSEREHEVLRLIALGHTNAEVAAHLVISVRTVETHRSNIQRKLGVRTRAELAGAAFRERIAALNFTEQTTTA